MSALKMFFCVVSESKVADITVHRELNSIYNLWNNETFSEKIGVIHIGFIRPKLPSYEEIEQFHGRILVSGSVKWSLPAEYNTSINPVDNNSKLPLFQLLTGFGYSVEIADKDEFPSSEALIESPVAEYNNRTIASAALEVLESLDKAMSKEEIYGYIIKRNLFNFGAKKPVSVLNVELNRHSKDTEYSHESSSKLFGKTKTGQFFALSMTLRDYQGWLKNLPDSSPGLAEICFSHGIFDDKSYFENKKYLSDIQIRDLELIRYQKLKNNINIEDPSELIPILPISILEAHISQLDLTVRTSNVFSVQKILTLKESVDYSLDEMMKWPNFGRKSAKDLCKALDESVEKLSFLLPVNCDGIGINRNVKNEESQEVDESLLTEGSNFDHVAKTSLKQHFENSLSELKDNARQILEYRTGYQEPVKTLEEVGKIIGVTRERIRQIQKKSLSKIITTEYWDDCIAIKIGELLLNREHPLYLEMLEVEDEWFAGFLGNYQNLAAIIELFSENQIRLLSIDGAIVISRICQEDWEVLVSGFRKSLKNKAKDKAWTKEDVNLTFKASLEIKGALELLPALWDVFNEILQFSTQDELLIAYGKTGETAVYTVLQQAEKPMHFSEIAERASDIIGRKLDVRAAHNSIAKQGGVLFARGVYGLPHFNPISGIICSHIRTVIEKTIHEGPLSKQWHVTELLNSLKAKFPSLPKELDLYILNIILDDSDTLTYLNKNVWARTDSGQLPTDRVDMSDAFTKILEDAGKPLKGSEIKAKLEAIRGVHESLQIQATERMLQVGPDTWGLIERDLNITEGDQALCLEKLHSFLTEKQEGIHVTEVDSFLAKKQLAHIKVGDYALLNVAQRDERFYLGRSMFLGLSVWGEDTRRYTNSQAIRKVLEDMTRPMKIGEINSKVESLTGLEVDYSVTGVLINEGGKYNSSTRLWEKVE
jgi:hypothetical protein